MAGARACHRPRGEHGHARVPSHGGPSHRLRAPPRRVAPAGAERGLVRPLGLRPPARSREGADRRPGSPARAGPRRRDPACGHRPSPPAHGQAAQVVGQARRRWHGRAHTRTRPAARGRHVDAQGRPGTTRDHRAIRRGDRDDAPTHRTRPRAPGCRACHGSGYAVLPRRGPLRRRHRRSGKAARADDRQRQCEVPGCPQ